MNKQSVVVQFSYLGESRINAPLPSPLSPLSQDKHHQPNCTLYRLLVSETVRTI